MALRPRDLASRMASRRTPKTGFEDGFLRETFTLSREKARDRAREFLNRYPKAAYMSAVESWRELPSNSPCDGRLNVCRTRPSLPPTGRTASWRRFP